MKAYGLTYEQLSMASVERVEATLVNAYHLQGCRTRKVRIP